MPLRLIFRRHCRYFRADDYTPIIRRRYDITITPYDTAASYHADADACRRFLPCAELTRHYHYAMPLMPFSRYIFAYFSRHARRFTFDCRRATLKIISLCALRAPRYDYYG